MSVREKQIKTKSGDEREGGFRGIQAFQKTKGKEITKMSGSRETIEKIGRDERMREEERGRERKETSPDSFPPTHERSRGRYHA